ncbi:virion protein US2 [Bovine alphaherpesvirus 2]|uniref:Virion protein US2 n=1 Tax=Bovine alphaherpesvirus 2 TaxID=10295 RepID=A0A7T1L7K8_9ALPH|nr:virion protein US2 [Bovine alphaherpesvirus 2]
MGVAAVSVVTLLTEEGAMPRNSGDANPILWHFLMRQCRILIAASPETPVVIRSADLRRVAGPLMDLPRTQRPIVRTRACDCEPATRDSGLFAEDEPGESVEVSSASAHLRALETHKRDRPYHAWIVGAADICVPLMEALWAVGRQYRVVSVSSVHGLTGTTWCVPKHLMPVAKTPWSPFPVSHNNPLREILGACVCSVGGVLPTRGYAAACVWLLARLFKRYRRKSPLSAVGPRNHPAITPCSRCARRVLQPRKIKFKA